MPSRFGGRLRNALAHPLTRGLDLDDPGTTDLRRRIIHDNRFLYRVYCDWYRRIAARVPAGERPALELGSGAGFMHRFVPGLIRSDVWPIGGMDLVADAHRLPFADAGLRAITMLNVLHHLPDVERFFGEAARCVAPGGAMVMSEPWVSPWSRWVYTKLHHEPFDPAAAGWRFASSGPLSGANGALPWLIFQRDRERFERQFKQWRIAEVRPHTPLRYLLSGGVSMRPLMPGFTHGLWRALEWPLARAAMFALVVLRRI